MAKTALITGIAGQDGSYLAEFLLAQGYRVVGMVRRSSLDTYPRISHLQDRIELRQADLLDLRSLIDLVTAVEPDEIYNLAAHSFIPTAWEQPVLTGEFTALGVARMLEAIQIVNPKVRFYQASSSEMFGNTPESPQNESTPFSPANPYGTSKLYGHFLTVNFRERYGLYACSGIFFNHESPRRGREFVTRKITWHAARIQRGLQDELRLGNLDARRDWGFAGDYVKAMWLMLQQESASDFVIGTGEPHSVRDFVETAFRHVGLNWQDCVRTDPALSRPPESTLLVADATRARKDLHWQPEVSFQQLVGMMVDEDLKQAGE